MRTLDNPQYVMVSLFGAPNSMTINLKHVNLTKIKQLRGRLSVPLRRGSQLIQVAESKKELEAAYANYVNIRNEAEDTGGIVIRDPGGTPVARLIVTEDGDLIRERIVQEQRGTPRV